MVKKLSSTHADLMEFQYLILVVALVLWAVGFILGRLLGTRPGRGSNGLITQREPHHSRAQ